MRGLVVPARNERFSADPVELFFDLGFVFAFSQLVGLLLDDPSWHGVGRASILFLLLWLPWTQFTWSANTVSGSSRLVRILFLIATAASVPMAASVRTAFDGNGWVFAIPLAVIFLTAIGMLLSGLDRRSAEYRSALRYASPNLAAMAVIVVGGFLDGAPQVIVWLVGITIVVFATVRVGGGAWIVRSGHLAERHGLIILVALGEVIVAIGNAAIIPIGDIDRTIIFEGVVSLVAAGAFAGLLWWAYFDRVARALEHRCGRTSPERRGRFARDVYSYAHTPIVAGIILSAVALEEIALHPDDTTDGVFRLIGAIGLALFSGGIAVAVYRAFRVVAVERLVAAAAIALVMVAGADLEGAWLITLLVAVLFVSLVVEHSRIEDPGEVEIEVEVAS